MIEYASHGVVAVYSDCLRYTDSINGGKTGFLFGNEGEILDILTRLIEQAPDFYLLRDRLSQACTGIGARKQADSCNERASLQLE